MANTALRAPTGVCKPDVPAESNWHTPEDAHILTAFYRYQWAHLALDAFGDTAPEAGEEARLWKIIDFADDQIGKAPATTPAGIIAKLWLAIAHIDPGADAEEAATRADLAWFEQQGDALDWSTRLIVEAIRSLAAMPVNAGGGA